MASRLLIFMVIYLPTISQVVLGDEACDQSKCKGPLAYYKDLTCTPIYGKDRCCPVKYNCSNLYGRAKDKCYYQGQVYKIGERVRDLPPCSPCTCVDGGQGTAQFACLIIDCIRPKPDCYFKASFTKCCGGDEVCPGNRTDLAKCQVDGNTYYDGQQFFPASDPNKSCICAKGYTGKNVAPFCRNQNVASCKTELYRSSDIKNHCAPVYFEDQNPATDCNYAFRCQNKDDYVIPAKVPCESYPGLFCKFGNLTMKVRDQLNQGTSPESVCLKCVCEVPPLPTCKHLTDSECRANNQTQKIQ